MTVAAPRPLQFHESVLESGARLVTIPLPHLARAHVGVTLRGGPVHEDDDTWGLSHLVEHMVFRGTRSFPDARAVAEAADGFGGEVDGSTFRDRVLYDTRVDPDALGDALHLLSEMVSAPRFEGLDTERRVIREELLEALDDDGQEIDPDNIAFRDVFRGRPLARSIDGTLETLDSFDETTIRTFFERGYGARHMVVVAAGPLDPGAVQERAEATFGRLPAGSAAPAGTPHGRGKSKSGLRVVKSDDSQTSLRLVFETPGMHHADRWALSLLGRVLDDGPSARIPSRLIDGEGLAYELWASWSAYEDAGALEVGAQVQHDRVAVVVEGVIRELALLRAEPPTADELARTKDRVRRDLGDLVDSPGAVVESVSRSRLFGASHDLVEIDRAIQSVTPAEVQRLARELLASKRAHLVLVGLPPRKQVTAAREALARLDAPPRKTPRKAPHKPTGRRQR